MKKRFLLILLIFLSGYSFAESYKEPYVFDMGSCLIVVPEDYKKVERDTSNRKYNFIDFNNSGVNLKVTSSEVHHNIKNEEKFNLIKSLDSVDLTVFEYDTTGFDFTIFSIEGELRVITLSHGTEEEALRIALSCSR